MMDLLLMEKKGDKMFLSTLQHVNKAFRHRAEEISRASPTPSLTPPELEPEVWNLAVLARLHQHWASPGADTDTVRHWDDWRDDR